MPYADAMHTEFYLIRLDKENNGDCFLTIGIDEGEYKSRGSRTH